MDCGASSTTGCNGGGRNSGGDAVETPQRALTRTVRAKAAEEAAVERRGEGEGGRGGVNRAQHLAGTDAWKNQEPTSRPKP